MTKPKLRVLPHHFYFGSDLETPGAPGAPEPGSKAPFSGGFLAKEWCFSPRRLVICRLTRQKRFAESLRASLLGGVRGIEPFQGACGGRAALFRQLRETKRPTAPNGGLPFLTRQFQGYLFATCPVKVKGPQSFGGGASFVALKSLAEIQMHPQDHVRNALAV